MNMSKVTNFYPTKYVGDGIELSQDPFMRSMQLKREAERLKRKAARAPAIYGDTARAARADYERFVAEWDAS